FHPGYGFFNRGCSSRRHLHGLLAALRELLRLTMCDIRCLFDFFYRRCGFINRSRGSSRTCGYCYQKLAQLIEGSRQGLCASVQCSKLTLQLLSLLLELFVSHMDLPEHIVKSIDQASKFIVSSLLDTQGIVPFSRHDVGYFRQLNNRLRKHPLQYP